MLKFSMIAFTYEKTLLCFLTEYCGRFTFGINALAYLENNQFEATVFWLLALIEDDFRAALVHCCFVKMHLHFDFYLEGFYVLQ